MAKVQHGHTVGHFFGKRFSRTYGSWISMKQRCRNKNHTAFSRYGAKGIDYVNRWEKFTNFLEDMGERPGGKSLDRIDNNKGYSKENCRWATAKEQANNKIIPADSLFSRAKLLKLLKAEANKDKVVRMSLRELGTKIGKSGEYVRILIGELESLGKIEVSRSKSRRNYITIL